VIKVRRTERSIASLMNRTEPSMNRALKPPGKWPPCVGGRLLA
jgi:hypothetical protein